MSIATELRIVLRNLGPSALNASLWATQTLASLALGLTGLMMLTMPIPELAGYLGGWVSLTSPSNIHLLGFIELVGAFGVVGPSFVRIFPKLSPVAAFSLAVMLTLAAIVHAVRGELQPLLVNVALAPMLLFIGWGRMFKSLITPHARIRC
jgi:hypothetical protein